MLENIFKNIRLLCGLGLVLAGTAGCIPSLHPLYTSETIVFDEALIGTWAGEKAKWNFEQEGSNSYAVVQTDSDGTTGQFTARLVQIGGYRFLDLYPDDLDCELNDYFSFHLIPAHTFMLVRQISPTLQLGMVDVDWIRKYLDEHPSVIKWEKVDDGILLTEQPAGLQKLMALYAEAAKDETIDEMERVEETNDEQPEEKKVEVTP